MKTAFFAAALAIGGTAALAQTDYPAAQPTQPPAPETQTTVPPETQPPMTTPPTTTPAPTTTETMATEPAPMPAAAGAGTGTVAPGNENPERDARGIPVVSDPAQVPAGANEVAPIPPGATFTPNPNQAQVFTPQPATEDYPACSRTVTDNCLQAYERGRSPEE